MFRKCLIVFLMCLPFCMKSQEVWTTKVSFEATEKKVPDILFELSDLVDFDFSYDSKIISSEQTINISVSDEMLKNVIEEIAQKSGLDHSLMDNQVIFYKSTRQAQKTRQQIRGIVKDISDGSLIQGASIDENYLSLHTQSDSNGAFQLDINAPSYTLFLNFSKDGYRDRTVKFKVYDDNYLSVQLEKLDSADMDYAMLSTSNSEIKLNKEDVSVPIIKSSLMVKNDSVKKSELYQPIKEDMWTKVFVNREMRESIKDDTFLLYNPVHVGIWPGLSTDFGDEARTIHNGISINTLIGLSAGIEGVTISTLAHINRFNIEGIQVSGLVNVSGGHTHGVQAAGLANHSKMKVNGVQVAGLYNMAGLNLIGVQAGGITNITRGKVDGIQVAGINNVATEGVIGMQVAGLANTANSTVDGMQLAGLMNTSREKLHGMQLAGLINIAEHTDGAQVSGFVNYTHKLSGFQFGFINVVDSLKYGTSIGFFSFVKNGYRRHEISMSKNGMFSYQFKSGTNSFYNVFSIGSLLSFSGESAAVDSNYYWTFGYGFGTIFNAEGRVWGSLEIVANSINENGWSNQLNMLNKASFNVGFRIKNRWSIFLGPNLSNYLYHESLRPAPIIPDHLIYSSTQSELNMAFWLGFQAGIQF